jgi:hypothetical protein
VNLLELILVVALAAENGHGTDAGQLPPCGNALINRVVKRVGCTLGDSRCWIRSRGFCGDHVEAKVLAAHPGVKLQLSDIGAEEVRDGDVAVFAARVHYAYVERVIRDGAGRPVAVDLSEVNFGACWVDPQLLVTDQYQVVSRRAGVPVSSVDGGFLRPRPESR